MMWDPGRLYESATHTDISMLILLTTGESVATGYRNEGRASLSQITVSFALALLPYFAA